MSTVASVSSVKISAPANFGQGITGAVSPVNYTQVANASSKVDQTKKPTATTAAATQNAAATTSQGLPESLLRLVSQPPAANSEATTDYQAMRIALETGNLSAAQRAYTRMQVDLVVDYSPQAGNGAASSVRGSGSANGTGLNAVA
jgi:hypothetical protein